MAISITHQGEFEETSVRSGLSESPAARWSMYLLMAFPIVDYALRQLPVIHFVGSVWYILIFFILTAITLKRVVAGQKLRWFNWHKMAGWYMLYGLTLVFTGIAHPIIALEGYRADIFYILYTFLLPMILEPEDVIKLLHIASSVAILIGVDGIYQYIVATPIPSGWVSPSEHVRTRVFSVITSPNELGSYMALMIPLMVGLALYEKNRWRKWMYGIGAVVCFATQLFTFDRGSLLALVASIGLVSVVFQRRLLLVVLAVAAIAFFIPAIHHRFTDLLSPQYWSSAQIGGRTARWAQAFDLMSAHPFFGTGIGRYGGQVASDFGLSVYSDSYYMKILGESGILGLVLYLSMHLSLLREVVQKSVRRMEGKARYIVLGGFIGLLAVALHNFVENVFEFGPMAFMYFSLTALYLIMARKGKHEPD